MQKYTEKKTDRQTFHSIKSKHPKSLKTSIPYSQSLIIKRICSKTTDFEYHLQELKERLVNQGYNKKFYLSTILKSQNDREINF